MSCNVLLIASGDIAASVADTLRGVFTATVTTARSRVEGLSWLRRGEFDLVLVEEAIAHGDAESADLFYELAGAAAVLEVNFALSGTARLLRQIRSALARRVHDQAQARIAVRTEMRNELSAALTGLLLEAQLALRHATSDQAQRLGLMVSLAEDLRGKLRPEIL